MRYVVLKLNAVAEVPAAEDTPDEFTLVGVFEAENPDAARELAVAEQATDEASGTYVAVSERYWNVAPVVAEMKLVVTVGKPVTAGA
jgi:hypothetical protein